MYIRCWGSRGSIPVSGKGYIKYGGDTTCLEIRSKEGDIVIVDSGTGIRNLGNKLMHEKKKNVVLLLTHAHLDHIMGFPFFRPLYVKGAVISILSCINSKSSAKSVFTKLMSRPFFPVQLPDKDIKASLVFKKIKNKSIKIGSLTIDSIPLSHPKDGGLGFRFKEDEKTFVFLTDNELGHVHKDGCTFNMYLDFCKNADLLIHDAEYEQKEYNKIVKFSEIPWGHSVIEDVVKLGDGANVKQLGFFHLNAMRTDDLVDNMVKKAKISLENKKIKCFAVGSGFEIVL